MWALRRTVKISCMNPDCSTHKHTCSFQQLSVVSSMYWYVTASDSCFLVLLPVAFYLPPMIDVRHDQLCSLLLTNHSTMVIQQVPGFLISRKHEVMKKLECGPMPNVMAALPNIGGALCSMPHFGWRSLLECRAVTLPRRETRWNLQGCLKVPNQSQPLVGRSSPYYEDIWRIAV